MAGRRRRIQNAEETELDRYENHVAEVENDSENGSSSGNEDDVNPFHRIPECDSSDGSSSHYQRRRSRHHDSNVKNDIAEPEEQTIARYLGGLKEEVADVVQLQPYWSFNDARKLALKVEKQQNEAKKRGFRSVAKESSSNRGSAPSYKPNTATKSSTTKASEKANVGLSSKVASSSSASTKKCFKCQGYGDIAFDCPNRKIFSIFEEEVEEEAGLSMPLDQEEEVTYADQGDLLVIRRSLSDVHDEGEDWLHLSPYYGDDGTYDSRASLLQPGEHDTRVFSKGSKELELLEYEIMGQVNDVLHVLYCQLVV
ncbi:hypothetical protein MRB53_024591 [Persea americana]|uniref:Uncharacterized protein n=1 Tax=Persea americana TaxID=3435 RepID=A0ACC2LD69_PERAE|nr:hypothetical protein MRB53_024591 [Persea americana]